MYIIFNTLHLCFLSFTLLFFFKFSNSNYRNLILYVHTINILSFFVQYYNLDIYYSRNIDFLQTNNSQLFDKKKTNNVVIFFDDYLDYNIFIYLFILLYVHIIYTTIYSWSSLFFSLIKKRGEKKRKENEQQKSRSKSCLSVRSNRVCVFIMLTITKSFSQVRRFLGKVSKIKKNCHGTSLKLPILIFIKIIIKEYRKKEYVYCL